MTEEVTQTPEQKALASQQAEAHSLSQQHNGTGNKEPAVPSNKRPEEAPAPKTDAEKAAEAKAAEEAAKTKEPELTKEPEDKEVGTTKWVQMQDPIGQSVIELLTDSGVSPLEGNAIFNKAVESGNLEDIDWATLEKKVKPGQFILIKAGVEQYYEKQYAPIRATVAKGYEIMGSEANWDTVKNWAHKAEKDGTLPSNVLNEIRQGIAQNGWIAEQSLQRLKGLYEADGKNKGLGVTKKQEATGTVQKNVGEGLTARQYSEEMSKLHSGMRQPNPAEVAALRARRIAGKAAGL